MTCTSIPPSLKPVVEDVAKKFGGERLWQDYVPDVEVGIIAFLNACVERGVGWRTAEYMPLEPDMPFENPAFVLNLGATDDKA